MVEQTQADMSINPACSLYNPLKLWIKLCRLYNRLLERFYSVLGKFVANHSLMVILICFIIMIALTSGIAFMETENRVEKLYIPQSSISISNLDKARDYGFYRPSRQTEVIVVNSKGTNVLTKECFRDALLLHEIITNISGYTDLCLPMENDIRATVVSSQCLIKEPLGVFNFSYNKFERLLITLNNLQKSQNMLFPRVFGKILRNASGQIISAESIRLVYYLKGFNLDEDISEKTTDWEKRFLNRMKAFDSSRLKCGPIFFTAGRSLDDSIAESVGTDIKLLAVTFIIMITFACCTLAKYRNPLTGHGLLAMGGTLCVCFGIMTGFGLSVLLNTPFISIVGLLPFLIFGVGIDDMFIIVDELDRTHSNQTTSKRVSEVMRHAGPAISLTTITDLLAFSVGTTSKFPAIAYFCTYAAFAIAFSFFFLATVFVAFMVYDCKRMNAGRRDMVSCLKAPAPEFGRPSWDEPLPQTSNKIMAFWGKLLMKPISKGIVVIVSLSLLGIGIYGTTFISEEFERRDLAKDGSEYIKFLDTLEIYFTDDVKVDIILESGVNYSDPSTQQKILNLSQIVASNEHYRSNVDSWFTQFHDWSAGEGAVTAAQSFQASLQQFLRSHPRFRSDILFSKDNSTVEASRLSCHMKQTSSSVVKRNAMTSLRNDLSHKSDLPVFASAYNFILYEQYVSSLPETIRNLWLAAMSILAVTSLFLVNPIVVALVLMGFVSLIFELLGLMYIWSVSLNSISMIILVMAIGFTVDYSTHIAHAFVFSRKSSAEEKVINALSTVGASVFMGGLSTFLGMVAIAFASSKIFRIFFKMVFGIVVLGLLHGLCFLPVWLAIFCRHHIAVIPEKQDTNNNPDTISPADNGDRFIINRNHEKSQCNPVMNSNQGLSESNSGMDSHEILGFPNTNVYSSANTFQSSGQTKSNKKKSTGENSQMRSSKTASASNFRFRINSTTDDTKM